MNLIKVYLYSCSCNVIFSIPHTGYVNNLSPTQRNITLHYMDLEYTMLGVISNGMALQPSIKNCCKEHNTLRNVIFLWKQTS
jgi:hypothetical protein